MKLELLFDIPNHQLKNHPLKDAIGGKTEQGKTYTYSTEEFVDLANQVSLGMWQIGLRPGDKVALISYNNRPEWNIMDIGLQQIGVINVPVYPTISAADYEYIFNDSEIKYCFVGYGDLLDKVRKAQVNIPSLKAIFTFDKLKNEEKDANGEAVNYWEDILTKGDMAPVEEIKKNIKPDDLATLIYTSGTTGHPKGVMLTHKNILSNVQDAIPYLPASFKSGYKALSFLPICHIFERTVTYAYMLKGIEIMYAQSIDTLSDNLKEVKPHFFTTVPRLLEKVYEKIATTAQNGPFLKRKIFNWADKLTETYEYDHPQKGLGWKIASKLVFSKIKAALGGNVLGILTGAAACPKKMAQFFSAAGIPIREGYGMTETSPAISIGMYEPHKAMLGTVGVVLPSVTVKIDENAEAYGKGAGEILVKGPNVMVGYYNKPDKTAEVFTEDGWLRTGDVGRLVKNDKGVEFLKITDRKKELLKTSGGKYVAPTPIETLLKQSLYIENAMIVGEKKKFVSAILTPSFETLEAWAEDEGIPTKDKKALVNNPKVRAMFEQYIKEINPNFGKVEQVKKFTIVPDEWSIESGVLTPTMKLKRRVVLERYQKEIDALYKV